MGSLRFLMWEQQRSLGFRGHLHEATGWGKQDIPERPSSVPCSCPLGLNFLSVKWNFSSSFCFLLRDFASLGIRMDMKAFLERLLTCLFPLPSTPAPNALKQTLFFPGHGSSFRTALFASQFFLLLLLPFHKILPWLHATPSASQYQSHVPNTKFESSPSLTPQPSSLPVSTGSSPGSPFGHLDPSREPYLSSNSCISTVPFLPMSQPMGMAHASYSYAPLFLASILLLGSGLLRSTLNLRTS